MKLIYRGYTYTIQPTIQPQSLQPRVINWRYRVAGKSYEPTPVTLTDRQPRAINWRYQITTANGS